MSNHPTLGTARTGSTAGGGGFPGYGGPPPRVATASSAGVALTVSRSDHTHALDIVAYAPTVVGMQATGVLQQTFAAGTATPTVLVGVNTRIPFFAATGLLTTSPNFVFADGTIGPTISRLTIGDGTNTTSARINLNGLAGAGTVSNQIIYQQGGTTFANQIAFRDPTAVTGSVQISMSITPVAGGSGNDQWFIGGAGQPAGTLMLFPVATDGDVCIGGPNGGDQLATNATKGFVWLPRVAGVPTGVPTRLGLASGPRARQATVIDVTEQRWYYYDAATAAWLFAPFCTLQAVGATAVTIPNSPGAAATPAEYLKCLGTGGAVRYIPLLA